MKWRFFLFTNIYDLLVSNKILNYANTMQLILEWHQSQRKGTRTAALLEKPRNTDYIEEKGVKDNRNIDSVVLGWCL